VSQDVLHYIERNTRVNKPTRTAVTQTVEVQFLGQFRFTHIPLELLGDIVPFETEATLLAEHETVFRTVPPSQ
jgi:hypothetical protein